MRRSAGWQPAGSTPAGANYRPCEGRRCHLSHAAPAHLELAEGDREVIVVGRERNRDALGHGGGGAGGGRGAGCAGYGTCANMCGRHCVCPLAAQREACGGAAPRPRGPRRQLLPKRTAQRQRVLPWSGGRGCRRGGAMPAAPDHVCAPHGVAAIRTAARRPPPLRLLRALPLPGGRDRCHSPDQRQQAHQGRGDEAAHGFSAQRGVAGRCASG